MLTSFFTRGPARILAVLLLLAGSALAFAVTTDHGTDTTPVSSDPNQPPAPSNTPNAAVFLRLGLGAEDLCAAGVQSAEVTTAIGAVHQAIASNATSLRNLDLAYSTARSDVDRLRRKVRSGLASKAEVAALAQAKTALMTAETNRDAYVDLLRRTALGTLATSVAADLKTIFDNRDWRQIPMEFRIESRTSKEWIDLRDDLAAERIHAKNAQPLPAAVQARLAANRAAAKVSAAKSNLGTYLSSVQSAWNLAVQ